MAQGFTSFSNPSGNKNAIINGAFDIWQRGTSFAAAANGSFSSDRWEWVNTGSDLGVVTVARSTDVPTLAEAGVLANYSYHVDVTTADASINADMQCRIRQRIEGFIWRNFAQRGLTFSFWVKATKTGTYCISAFNTGADRHFITEYTINTTNTWEKKTITIPASPSAGTWDYTTGIGLEISFILASGSTLGSGTAGSWQSSGIQIATSNQVNGLDSTSNDFRIALVQLEVGDVATPFEIRPYPLELQMCQRYYQQSWEGSMPGYTYYLFGSNATTAGALSGQIVNLLGTMRIAPTMVYYDAAGTANRVTVIYGAGSYVNGQTYAEFAKSTTAVHLYANAVSGSPLTPGGSCGMVFNWTASAEF